MHVYIQTGVTVGSENTVQCSTESSGTVKFVIYYSHTTEVKEFIITRVCFVH